VKLRAQANASTTPTSGSTNFGFKIIDNILMLPEFIKSKPINNYLRYKLGGNIPTPNDILFAAIVYVLRLLGDLR